MVTEQSNDKRTNANKQYDTDLLHNDKTNKQYDSELSNNDKTNHQTIDWNSRKLIRTSFVPYISYHGSQRKLIQGLSLSIYIRNVSVVRW